MALASWLPSTIYPAGTIVIPTIVGGAAPTTIANADFESGDSGWTKGTGWAINTNLAFSGTYSAEYSGPGVASIISTVKQTVAPGKSITASCFVHQGASDDGQASAAVTLSWYDGANALISTSTGNAVNTGAVGIWRKSTVSATAPALAASVSIGATANNDFAVLNVDNFAWNYVTGVAATGLAFKNISAEAGTSGVSEPAWPGTVGGTVVDNDITWEAVAVGSVTWQASSILTSGSTEPTWPAEPGAYVSDGNIAWESVPLWIEDEKCPHSKVVAIAASKVFAGDTDVVRFCATLNARDWSSADDAGFLPTGLQQKSQVGVDAMNVYRANLAIWSASNFQVWQVDPDPAAMALLDAMEGIGSVHQQAVQPVSDDLFFLSTLGVRTVAIAQGTNNLASGDAGVPIDTLVQAEVNAGDVEPIATYYPGAGQYWLAFRPLSLAASLLAGQFLLTSPIYPIEATDELTFGFGFNGGYTQGVNVENVTFQSSALNSFLDNIVIEAGTHVESVAFETSALGGDLDEILLETGIHTESVSFETSALDGELEFALVRHTNPAEALDWEFEWTGGTTS